MSGYVGTAPGTTTVKLPDGRVVQFTDWIDDKHYANGEFSTGDTTAIDLFSTGKSQVIPGGSRNATRVDNNLPRSGDNGLPKDWEFLCYSIGLDVTRVYRSSGGGALSDYSDPVILSTLFDFARKTYFGYFYNGKVYAEGVLFHFPQGFGPSYFTTQSTRESVTNGPPDARGRISLVLPLHERENLGYKMTAAPEVSLTISQAALDGSTALASLDVRATKYGLIRRNVN